MKAKNCEECGKVVQLSAVVGLNGSFMCIPCFEKAMAKVGERMRRLRGQWRTLQEPSDG